MNKFKQIDNETWQKKLSQKRAPLTDLLHAMYSSLTGSITTDPLLMNIPIDDHLTHRGDGVFESMKCLDEELYNAMPHIERLERSCKGIGMELPATKEELLQIICDTIRVSEKRNCLIRILVSRGTGNMGIDPTQCDGPELYVVIYKYTSRAANGKMSTVRSGISSIPIKPPQFATIKTCNYLPNALMKLEAHQRDLDLVICIDQNGNIGEGATENIGIVTENDELLMPPPENILTGTTARRALDLAQKLVDDGSLKCAKYQNFTPEQTLLAKEIMLFGTTTDVTPIVEWEGKTVGDGTIGSVASKLFDLLTNDMTPKSEQLIKVFG